MPNQSQLHQIKITGLVIAGLQDILAEKKVLLADPISASTGLVGPQAALDSLGLVTLLVDLEQKIDEAFGCSLTLADERAMSQKSSPFRTVQSLSDYIAHLLEMEEAQRHVRA